jgi:hypothetical protein
VKPSKEIMFPELFSCADAAVGNCLIMKTEILKIHAIRNAAQHQGTIPSERDIESSLIYAEDFLTRGFLACFRLKFNDISVSDLITDLELRAHLKKMEDFIHKEDFENATKTASIAFDTLKNKYKKYYGDVAFDRGHHFILDFLFSIFDMQDKSEEAKLKRQAVENIMNSIANELDRINDRLYAISLGANMQEYLFFRNNTPRVIFAIKGPRFVSAEPILCSEEKAKKILIFLQNIIIHWESLIP